MVSFFAGVVATTGLTVVAVLVVATVGVVTGAFATTGVAATDVVFAPVDPGRLGVDVGFFDAIAPAEVAVATAGPGDDVVADAHGSTVCAFAAGGGPFL